MPADLGVQYVDEFVARVKTIGTDDDIEVTSGAAREAYASTRSGLIDRSDRIAEDRLHSIFKRAVESCGELAALHRDVSPAGDAQETGYARTGDATSQGIDDAQLPDDVTAARDLR